MFGAGEDEPEAQILHKQLRSPTARVFQIHHILGDEHANIENAWRDTTVPRCFCAFGNLRRYALFFEVHLPWGAQFNVFVFVAVLWPAFCICSSVFGLIWVGIWGYRGLWGVWGHFLVYFGSLGRPWGDLGRPVSIFDRFRVTFGAQNGSLWGLRCPSWALLGALLRPRRAKREPRSGEKMTSCEP